MPKKYQAPRSSGQRPDKTAKVILWIVVPIALWALCNWLGIIK
jgi:hypothetical protein